MNINDYFYSFDFKQAVQKITPGETPVEWAVSSLSYLIDFSNPERDQYLKMLLEIPAVIQEIKNKKISEELYSAFFMATGFNMADYLIPVLFPLFEIAVSEKREAHVVEVASYIAAHCGASDLAQILQNKIWESFVLYSARMAFLLVYAIRAGKIENVKTLVGYFKEKYPVEFDKLMKNEDFATQIIHLTVVRRGQYSSAIEDSKNYILDLIPEQIFASLVLRQISFSE